MEWIRINNVKELPKHEKKIIVWVREESRIFKYGPWFEATCINDNWCIEGGLSVVSTSDITHYCIIRTPIN